MGHAWNARAVAITAAKALKDGGSEVLKSKVVSCRGSCGGTTTKTELMHGEAGGEFRADGWWCRKCCGAGGENHG